ncbi:hypothetical protein BJ508DRAFT_418861 [Ascobolus immersus RN42]|uniref:RNA polymerase III RPC4-domain-containing protein n=1 Tax=Ascobolus immersus RN42 TaxID=1160509 RepID=A0A3N4HMX5_ASCIM|nr:hypothetical protein BJ508DRAFT_418861 [Ascobolus immersus RN42]
MPPKSAIKPKAPPRRKAANDDASTPATSGEPSSSSAPTADAPGTHVAPVAPMVAPAVPVASLPVAPPVGRLDSMRKPLSINTGAARGAKPGLKFKPKAPVRRSKEELEAIAAQEAIATAAAEGANPAPFAPRDRGSFRGRGERGGFKSDRGGKGRGGPGKGGFKKEEQHAPVATGVFSMGSVVTGRKQVIIERRGDDKKGGLGGLKFGRSTRAPKLEDGNYKDGYVSDDDDGPKIDIDKLEELSGDEFDDVDRETGFPIRVDREVHPESHRVVNTEKIGEARKKTVKKTVKNESTSDTEDLPDAPSPEKDGPTEPELDENGRPIDPSEFAKSQEELYERDFAEDERWKLLEDLGAVLPEDVVDFVDRRAAAQAAGDTDIRPLRIQMPAREQEFFYLQFPQMMKSLVKEEDKSGSPIMMDLTQEEDSKKGIIKSEEPSSTSETDMTDVDKLPYNEEVGRLRFHESGRITIRWGFGDDVRYYDVTRGFENRFAQEIYGFNQEATEFKDDNQNNIGHAYYLGNVAGRLVISTAEESLGMEKEN